MGGRVWKGGRPVRTGARRGHVFASLFSLTVRPRTPGPDPRQAGHPGPRGRRGAGAAARGKEENKDDDDATKRKRKSATDRYACASSPPSSDDQAMGIRIPRAGAPVLFVGPTPASLPLGPNGFMFRVQIFWVFLVLPSGAVAGPRLSGAPPPPALPRLPTHIRDRCSLGCCPPWDRHPLSTKAAGFSQPSSSNLSLSPFPVGQQGRGRVGGEPATRRANRTGAILHSPLPPFSLPTDYLTLEPFCSGNEGRPGGGGRGAPLFSSARIDLTVPGGRDSTKYLATRASPDISSRPFRGRGKQTGEKRPEPFALRSAVLADAPLRTRARAHAEIIPQRWRVGCGHGMALPTPGKWTLSAITADWRTGAMISLAPLFPLHSAPRLTWSG